MSSRFHRKPGCWGAEALAGLLLLLMAGCNYGFQGGGGFPAHIRTIYIETFENQTQPPQFDLETQLFNKLMERLPRSFGVRPAGRDVADAVLRGRVTRYDDVAQNYRPAAGGGGSQVLEHQVQIGVSVELVDVQRNLVLWESQGLTGRGEYLRATQTDQVGKAEAIEHIVQQIIDGAQSQW